jgi:hypothetical protein
VRISPIVVAFADCPIFRIVVPFGKIWKLAFLAIVVVFQEKYYEVTIPVGLMLRKDQIVIVCLLSPHYVLVVKLEILFKIFFNNILFTVCAGIIDDGADERERGLLHCKAIQGICDIMGMIESEASYADLPLIIRLFVHIYSYVTVKKRYRALWFR